MIINPTDTPPPDTGAADASLNQRIAQRVHELRNARRLSLESLASRSGVSRSMISLIERGESSPTAVVLERLATGLGVTLAALFEPPLAAASAASPVSRAAGQVRWTDPHSGYVRRNVSPPGCLGAARSPIQIVEVMFPPGQRVTYESAAREPVVHQQIWVLAGRMEISVGDTVHRLDAGDCLAHRLDQPMSFHNPTRKPARYAVVIATLPAPALDWN